MTKNIYTGKVVTLNIDRVQLPNGETVDLETIRHPGAAAVVPVKDDGTVVLIRQFRHAAGGSSTRSRRGSYNLVKLLCNVPHGSWKKRSAIGPRHSNCLSAS